MDKNVIGMNAGKIWRLLNNNEKLSYDALKSESGLKDEELGAAIGWLAREGKIEFYHTEEHVYIYLNVNLYIG